MAIFNFLKKKDAEEIGFPSQPAQINPESVPVPKKETLISGEVPKTLPMLKTVSMPIIEEKQEVLIMPEALMVKMEAYNIGHSYVITLERDMQRSLTFLTHFNTLKSETDSTLISFYQLLEDIQRKLVHIDKKLFNRF